MPFQKGNPIRGGVGLKGISGRKKSLSRLMKEAIETDAQNLPLYFQSLSEKARNGDRDAAIYLINRHLGKPLQQTELDIKGGEGIGAGLMVEILKVVAAERRRLSNQVLIEGGKDAITGRSQEGISEGLNEEAEV